MMTNQQWFEKLYRMTKETEFTVELRAENKSGSESANIRDKRRLAIRIYAQKSKTNIVIHKDVVDISAVNQILKSLSGNFRKIKGLNYYYDDLSDAEIEKICKTFIQYCTRH